MASPINSILGLKCLPKEYQSLNECGSRIDELKGRRIGAAFPSACFGKQSSVLQAPFRQTVTVILNDVADCSSFSLSTGFDEPCESESDSDEDGILRLFEDELLESSNDLSNVARLRFILCHEDRCVATYRALLWNKRLCLMLPSDEDSSGSALACLLDYASEKLGCEAVLLCLPRNEAKATASVRSYMFLGFENLPPIHELCQGLNTSLFFFMAYHM